MITVLLGTRAQLIKMAPVILELERRGWNSRLILTGQHKDDGSVDFGLWHHGAACVYLRRP